MLSDWARASRDSLDRLPLAARPNLSGRWAELLGSTAGRQRLAQKFPRSLIEFYAAFVFADISFAKGDHFLGVVTNSMFRPQDIPYRSLETVEHKILKACFPDGYQTIDLTRTRDGDQKLILHFVPFKELARRLLCRRLANGKQYHGFEVQLSTVHPGRRVFGRSNSGAWYETSQALADHMMREKGVQGKCRVAGLLMCSDNSFGGKNMGWHGVYGKCMFNNMSKV